MTGSESLFPTPDDGRHDCPAPGCHHRVPFDRFACKTDDGITPGEIARAEEIGPPDFLLDKTGKTGEFYELAAENTRAMASADPRTADQKRRDADGVDYGSLENACPSGHNHYCPECGKQHMHDGGNHPDCELRGFDHSWNRWERHAVDDRVMFRLCDRCGASERQRLDV